MPPEIWQIFRAKKVVQFITEIGVVGNYFLDYKYYEELYGRLKKLEQLEEKRKSWEVCCRFKSN
jgi:hypothetical protein